MNLNQMNKTTITYHTAPAQFEVTNAEYDVIHSMYGREMKVTAIKFIRTQYGIGLYEAKQICDVIGAQQRPVTY